MLDQDSVKRTAYTFDLKLQPFVIRYNAVPIMAMLYQNQNRGKRILGRRNCKQTRVGIHNMVE